MNSRQVELVQESFVAVAPIAEEAAALFYKRLFVLDPTVRPMFRTDLREQGKKLMATLALVVRSLDRPERIVGAVRHLGARHAGYGVQPSHYETVGAALLWALEQGLGEAYTEEVAAAWAAAYSLLADLMIQAAAELVAA